MRCIKGFLLLFAPTLLASCASMLSGTSETIRVDSNPQNADATLVCGIKRIGSAPTPAKFTIARNAGNCTVTVDKNGYVEQSASIEQGVNPLYWGNFVVLPALAVGAFYGHVGAAFVGDGLPIQAGAASGFVIDRASGAIHTHRPNKLRLTLQPR